MSAAPLSVREAAGLLGICPEKMKHLINRGEAPPYVQIDGKRLFLPETLQKWLKARERLSIPILRQNKALVEKFAGKARKISENERRSRPSRSIAKSESQNRIVK